MKAPKRLCPLYFKNAAGSLSAYPAVLAFCSVALLLALGAGTVHADWPRMVPSKDGTKISYEMYGSGEPTLVFVHGWSCDGRYWRAQVPHFSRTHRVVVLDLAGHGHSGMTREHYTMKSFGEDVQAVTETVGSPRVILIGHSMGGPVIAEAARVMPDRVMGLVGVDTFHNVEYPMTQEEFEEMVAPMKKSFPVGAREFVNSMMLPSTDPVVRDWILSDMSAAPSNVALSAMKQMMSQYISGEAATIFEEIRVPVVAVCADMWPVDQEANRKHMAFFDAIVLEDTDHFLMMHRAQEFNEALERAIETISKKSTN